MLRLNRRDVALIVTVLVLLWVPLSRPASQVFLGDRIQIALPAIGAACAFWRGGLGEYVGRFAGSMAVVHGLKRGLGEAEMNRRPNGRPGGFPSGHAAASVYGASYLVRECGALLPYAGPAAALAAGYVGGSRIDAGRHDLVQVMAGALIALFFDLSFRRAGSRRRLGAAARAVWARLRSLAPDRALPLALALCVAAAPAPAPAETILSVYSGVQGAAHSDVEGRDGAGARIDFRAGWEGRPFEPAPYYGLRATRWLGSNWGVALDFTHAKLYADDATVRRSGFGRLDFTHGLNIATVNLLRRFPGTGGLTPYAGLGAGFVYPHVEVTLPDGDRTYGYQFGGPALQAQAGAAWAIGPRWAVFAEYKGAWVGLDVDLDGGGRLTSDVIVNAVNLGLSYGF
jgi:lipid A oxidase